MACEDCHLLKNMIYEKSRTKRKLWEYARVSLGSWGFCTYLLPCSCWLHAAPSWDGELLLAGRDRCWHSPWRGS
jgi:hypothetical protein